MKIVLCAVDISNTNQDSAVLREAAAMADMHKAQLDVITIVPSLGMAQVGNFFGADYAEKATAHAEEGLKAMVRDVLGADRAANVRHVVSMGTVYEEILKVARVDNADLIVIGAHKPDFSDYLLGPNAARVARHATASVYIVRD